MKKINPNVIFICFSLMIIYILSISYQQYKLISYENKIDDCVKKRMKEAHYSDNKYREIIERKFCISGYKKY